MNHPTKGTCNDTRCKHHGRCHCGCNQPTSVADQNRRKRDDIHGLIVRGMPMIYCSGHNPTGGFFTKEHLARAAQTKRENRIPIEKVRPLARWLVTQVGTEKAAEMCEVPHSTFKNVAYDRSRTRVKLPLAKAIHEAVLMLAPRPRKVGVFDTYELGYTRQPTPEERELAERDELEARRQRDRAQQRRHRAGLAKPRAKPVEVDRIPICEKCGEEIQRKKSDHTSRYLQRRYCSRKCMHTAVGNISYGKGVAS